MEHHVDLAPEACIVIKDCMIAVPMWCSSPTTVDLSAGLQPVTPVDCQKTSLLCPSVSYTPGLLRRDKVDVACGTMRFLVLACGMIIK